MERATTGLSAVPFILEQHAVSLRIGNPPTRLEKTESLPYFGVISHDKTAQSWLALSSKPTKQPPAAGLCRIGVRSLDLNLESLCIA